MGRNIILLSDGTGNSAAKLHKTNVWRVYQALDLTTDHQLVQYDDGVGTSSLRPLALIGGGFGLGLANNVRRLYAFLSRNYGDAQDKVFAFGFSRGAYTIRVLIGLVRNQGLVDAGLPERQFQREVLRRWDTYRRTRFREQQKRWLLRRTLSPQRPLEEVECEGRVPQFTFVGLWDTVGAYGLPIDEIQHAIDLYLYPFSFRDRHLSSIVQCAYHALALDDERRTFHPVLWDESDPKDHARLQQVWFPGVHANVGGGYPKDGLAYISLEWIVTRARALGLDFLDAHLTEIRGQVDAHDQLYNSRAGLAGYYRYSPRPITTLGHDTLNGVTIDRPKVHASVFARIHGEHVAYAPIGLPPVYDLVLRDGTIVPWEQIEQGAQGQSAPVSPFIETHAKARQRATRMEAVWNIVWWRRIVYFLSLFSSLFLAALPWLATGLSTQQTLPGLTRWLTRYLDPLFTISQFVVPAWVGKTWLSTFGEEPVLFLLGFLGLAVTQLIGSAQEETIRSHAGEIWHDRWQSVPLWAQNPTSTWLYKLRSNKNVIKAYRYFAWRILPTLVLLLGIGTAGWLWWQYPGHITLYMSLTLLVIWVRNWVLRAQYTATKQTSRSADPSFLTTRNPDTSAP